MTRLLYIGNRLASHGNTATTSEILGPLLEQEGFSIRYSSSCRNKLARMIDMVGAALRFAPNVDFVLIDTYSTSNFWYAFLVSQLCRILRKKYIPVLGGGDLPTRLAKSPVPSRMIFGNAHVNIAPSGYLMEAFSRFGIARLHYIPNTLQICEYDYLKRISVRPRLLWVRSFTPIYNPKMAIDVVIGLQKIFPDATLCMVGPDKGSRAEIEAYASGQGANVVFAGKLTKAEWRELSKQYDIFVNTTHFDNMPLSVVEAMALGLPVVSTNVGGLPYLLQEGKTALLVNDSDTQGMISAIKKLVHDAEFAQCLAQDGRDSVMKFDWSQVRLKWLEILKSA